MEEFERSQPIVGWEINPSESTTMGEQLMQETSANPVPQASNLNSDTLATAVSLLENTNLDSCTGPRVIPGPQLIPILDRERSPY